MGERQDPHKQRLRTAPIGRTAVLLTPQVRQVEKTVQKFAPIVFSPEVQKAIRLGKMVKKHTIEVIQHELYKNPNTQLEIITLTDLEVEAILKNPVAKNWVDEEPPTKPRNPFEAKDFIDFYDEYFAMTIF